MRKRFFAGLVLSLVLCSSANASDWSGYFKIGWSAITNLFSSESKSSDIPGDETLPNHIASDWGNLTDSLNDALTLRDKQDSLPKSSWVPFKEDQESNAKKINSLLDTALSILVKGEAGDMRRKASELREKISAWRLELDDVRNRKIHAPEKSYLPWKMTREKAEKRIAELEEEIQEGESDLNVIDSKLMDALKEIGLDLDGTQIEILMHSVTGDDLLQNTIIFSNVKSVVTKLEELSQNETNSFEITKRYTGMYLVLNDLLIHTQEELVKKIDSKYKPELDGIIKEAETLRKEALTKSMQNIYNEGQRKSFAVNAENNDMTIKVAKLYIELLNSQKTGTMNSINSLRLNRDLAENTYKTVRSSGELKGLIHSGLNLFDAAGALAMPELKVFESGGLQMRLEFEEINRRLKK